MTVARITLDRHTVRQILDGTCTHAIKLTDREPEPGHGLIFRAGEHRSACRIHIDQVVPTTVGQAIADNPQKLGAPDRTEARRRWLAVHDRRVRRLTGEQQAALTAPQIADLWTSWQHKPCWLLIFALDTSEHSRLLARTGKATGHKLVDRDGFARRVDASDDHARGYTTTPQLAINGADEAVDDLWLERFAEHARDQERQRHQVKVELARRLLADLPMSERNKRLVKMKLDELKDAA